MKEIFRIGHISIYFFGVTIAIGMIVGLWVLLREAKRKSLDSDKIFNLEIYSLIASIIGARLYYIIAFDLSYYIKNPKSIFLFREGGLSIQGGLIFGILFAILYSKKIGFSFWKASDAAAPAIIIGQAIGRIGCDVFGISMKNINLWGIKINGQILHPVQMYEMILDLILFTYLWRKRGKIKYNGQLFLEYIIGFSIIRALVEFFRSNPIAVGQLTVAHVTSFIIIIIAILISRRIKYTEEITITYLDSKSVTMGIVEYILVLLIGIVGIVVYYNIHL